MCDWLTLTKSVTCYKTDSSFRQGERPTTDNTTNVLIKAKIGHETWKGLEAKTDGLTEWLTVSCKVTLPLIPATSPWRWKQHGRVKRWYPITSIQKTSTPKWLNDWPSAVKWLPLIPTTSPWRWRYHRRVKRWYSNHITRRHNSEDLEFKMCLF